MERTLNLTIKLNNDNDVFITTTEPESGVVKTEKYVYVGSDPHPEFNEGIGDEVYSWISLWMDEIRESVETEAVETCPHCGHENAYKNHNVDRGGYMAVCKNCGRVIMLCDECRHADDNPDQHCDWCRACDYGVCKRGVTYED